MPGVAALGSGRGWGWAAGGCSAGRVTVPFRLKLDNSPGPISLLGGEAVDVLFDWASDGAAASAHAIPSTPAFATIAK